MLIADQFRNRAGDGLTVVAIAIALAVVIPIALNLDEYGWIAMGFGIDDGWFWPSVLVWLPSTILAIRWRRRWWLLVIAPAVLLPALVVAAVTFECSRGNCL